MNLDTLRRYSREWCEFATNTSAGRKCSDAVYQWIVERRDRGPGYSSCADLAHWLLFRVGCRADAINRAEHRGWKAGVNVSRLAYWKGVAKSWPRTEPVTLDALARHLQTGDVCIIWRKPDSTDAHVCIFDRVEGGKIHTWDAGQGAMANPAWSGGKDLIEVRRRIRSVSEFPLKVWVPLSAVAFTADPDVPSGDRLDEIDGRTEPAPMPEDPN
jgi:hypothetical protein